MNLRLRNPLRGSMDPWPLTTRLTKFIFTAAALVFLNIHQRIFERVVRHNSGFTDPQALPKAPRRIASWLCVAATAFLFLAVGYIFADRSDALWAISLAVICYWLSGWWLRRTIWGLNTAFRPPTRLSQVLRRLMEVIHHQY